MDKKTIAATALSTASAGGGGYLIYHAATSGSTEVQTVSEPSKKVEDSKKPKPATDEKVAPPKAKPADPVPAAAPKVVPLPPKNTGPKPGSISTQTHTTFQDDTLGSLYKDYLLSTIGNQDKWEAKLKKLEAGGAKSKYFLAVKNGLNKLTYLQSQCSTAYTWKKEVWPKPNSGWDNEEPKKYWDDVWTYCSVDDQVDKPGEWPFKEK